jgi:NitT/TauT family transport system permease protein
MVALIRARLETTRLDTAWLILFFLIVWEALSLAIGRGLLVSPVETLIRAGGLLFTSGFWSQAAATLRTLVLACLLVFAVGLGAGCLIGSSRLASDVVEPLLVPIYAIPKIALYPIILLIFGLSPMATIVFAAIHGIFPVMIFTIGGIRNIRPIYIHAARAMRLSRAQTIRGVLVPAAIPQIVTGLRIGFATTLFGALIAELFASTGGLGFMLIRATDAHDMASVMAITVLLFVFAVAANALISRAEIYVRHGRG